MGKGGGGGGLRILPHKSWNVYNVKNQIKVRQDEAKHAAEQAVLREKQQKAEAEFRLNVLRDRVTKAKEEQGLLPPVTEESTSGSVDNVDLLEDSTPILPSTYKPRQVIVADSTASAANAQPSVNDNEPPKHINLFEDVERDMSKYLNKRQKELEAKAKELQMLKKVVPTMFFASYNLDDSGKTPWYSSSSSTIPKTIAASGSKADAEADAGIKSVSDPLMDINEGLGKRRKRLSSAPQSSSSRRQDRRREEMVEQAKAKAAAKVAEKQAIETANERVFQKLQSSGYKDQIVIATSKPNREAVVAAMEVTPPATTELDVSSAEKKSVAEVLKAEIKKLRKVVKELEDSDSASTEQRKHKKRKRSVEKSHSHKHHKSSSSPHKHRSAKTKSSGTSAGDDSLERLRREREEREAKERRRTAALLGVPEWGTQHKNSLTGVRPPKYNSGYQQH